MSRLAHHAERRTRSANDTPLEVNYTTFWGQLTQASGRGSNIEYRYSATANDGRITSRKDNVSGEEVSYQYDQLGCLIAASTTGPEWGLSWVYL